VLCKVNNLNTRSAIYLKNLSVYLVITWEWMVNFNHDSISVLYGNTLCKGHSAEFFCNPMYEESYLLRHNASWYMIQQQPLLYFCQLLVRSVLKQYKKLDMLLIHLSNDSFGGLLNAYKKSAEELRPSCNE
jgi:hypothetical protein